MWYTGRVLSEVLPQNGLTEKEAKIYLAALESGEATAAHIAMKAHLERPTVYAILEKMKEKGLVTQSKRRGVLYFAALPPQILIDRMKRSAEGAERALPLLLELAYSSPLKPRIRFYEGMDGLKEIMRQISFSKEAAIGFTDYEMMPEELFQFIRKELTPRRRKLGNFIRLIIPRTEKNLVVQREDPAGHHYGEHRIVDFPEQETHIEIVLFEADKIAFISFIPGEMFGVIMHSAAIHHTLKDLFFVLWNNAEKANQLEH